MPARRKLTIAALAVVVGGVLTAFAATAGHAAAARGVMTPAVGPDPKMSLIGNLNQPGPLRSCQRAGTCYGPDQVRNAYGFQSLLDNGLDGSGSTIVIIARVRERHDPIRSRALRRVLRASRDDSQHHPAGWAAVAD
jgi:hypothetical protein